MDMRHPSSGHDQAEDPIKTNHPEEEEHHESGASKMFKRVKARAKKFKNSLTKHDNEHDHDVDEEDDDNDEQEEPEKHGAPVYESSAVRRGVTGQPEPLSHPRETTNVPAPEEIIPPKTKVSPVVSSDYTEPVEPATLRDASYGHEALSHSVAGQPEPLSHPRETNVPAPEEIIPPKTKVSHVVSSDYTEPVEPATLRYASYGHEALSHSVRRTDKSDREESREAHHDPLNTHVPLLSATEDVTSTFAPGQREVNTETPKRLEEDDLSVECNDQSKGSHHTRRGGEEAGVAGFAESLDRIEGTDESRDERSGLGFESQEFEQESESRIGKDSPTRFGGESGAELREDFPVKSNEFDQQIESGGKPRTGLREDFPAKSPEFEQTIGSGIGKDTGGGKPGTERREDFLGKKSPTGFGGESETGMGEVLGVKNDSGSHGYGDESGGGLEKNFPARNDDVKVETGTHGHEDRDDFDSKAEETINETQKPKPSIYTEKIGSATSFVTDKAKATKNAVGKHESPVGVEIEKLTPEDEKVKEAGPELGGDFPTRSHEFDQKIESGIGKDSPTGFGAKLGTALRKVLPAKNNEFEQTIESGVGKGTDGGTERREDFLGKSYEFDQQLESAIGKDSPTGFGRESETGIDKDSTKGNHGYGEESGGGLEKKNPARNDDEKVETGLGRDLPTGTNDQFSGPKETDHFDEQTRYETQEPKPSSYTEMIGSATSLLTDKAMATKNAAVSSLGYSGETASGQHQSPMGVDSPKTATGTVAEKLTLDDENVKETGSPLTTKLPLSGGGNGEEETKQGEDKAFSEMIAEKLNLGGRGEEKKTATAKEVEVKAEKNPSDEQSEEKQHGEAVAEEETGGGGMVGKIKGAYNYWLGGTTEEVKPKSPVSVEESSQSLGSTVGTKGFPDSGESGLGETGSGTGAVPAHRGL